MILLVSLSMVQTPTTETFCVKKGQIFFTEGVGFLRKSNVNKTRDETSYSA